jgi:uncharacterized oligopeptide transporter (OPT) family protein
LDIPSRGRGDAAPHPAEERHPSVFYPATFVGLVLLSLLGAVIGIQLLVTLGVTANTSIIGALVAMIVARIPLQLCRGFRSVHVQNLAQSAISSATFGAANSLLLPIAVPYLLDRPDLVLPMFLGVAAAMLLDGFLLWRLFGSKIFPATGAWPPGVAAAEAIKAGDAGGTQARLLGAGLVTGIAGAWWGVPMSAFGIAFIGNVWALSMFAVGLLTRGYSEPLFGLNINALYIPHGMMVGAGLVALLQVGLLIVKRHPKAAAPAVSADAAEDRTARILGFGWVAYLVLSVLIAFGAGLQAEMSWGMLLLFVLYAAFAAYVHELIVGIAAMHSGWFPAFAVALITLLFGLLLGFPPVALAILTGFSAATGPAFADMGYDLKAGWILRGQGGDARFEMEGRRQQFLAALIAFVIAMPVVLLSYNGYFAAGLVPPVAKVYVATIQAGLDIGVAWQIFLWAIPGALIQLVGGPKRQLGVLLATGLLIAFPIAGWAVTVGLVLRLLLERFGGEKARGPMEVMAGGVIAGDALYSFFNSVIRAGFRH